MPGHRTDPPPGGSHIVITCFEILPLCLLNYLPWRTNGETELMLQSEDTMKTMLQFSNTFVFVLF
jgi:hypothetical protein